MSDENTSTVTIALVQMSCTTSRQENIDRAVGRIVDAAAQGAKVVCLQELFHSRYPCQSEDHQRFEEAESIEGQTCAALSTVAKQHGVVVIGPIFERRAAGVYHNSAVVIDADGSQAGLYRKMHIPDDPLYYEKFYFTPGDLGFAAHTTEAGRLGVLVCWDQWFPEAARCTALRGAQILIIPTAIAWSQDESAEAHRRQYEAWLTVQRGHAIVNGVFVAAINRTGIEDALRFWGRSFVAGPDGAVVAQADGDADEVLLADCPLSEIRSWRNVWPFLRDRRIDAYDDLTQRLID